MLIFSRWGYSGLEKGSDPSKTTWFSKLTLESRLLTYEAMALSRTPPQALRLGSLFRLSPPYSSFLGRIHASPIPSPQTLLTARQEIFSVVLPLRKELDMAQKIFVGLFLPSLL